MNLMINKTTTLAKPYANISIDLDTYIHYMIIIIIYCGDDHI